MAKLIGPLFSEKAHGTVADVLTYSSRKTVNQVRFQRKQKVGETTNQAPQRARFWAAIQWWKDLDASEKAIWNTLGNNA